MRARRPMGGSPFPFIALAGAMTAASPTARAADNADQRLSISNQETASSPDIWSQVRDLGGLRSALQNLGVQITFSYYGETFGNPLGGARQGLIYQGRLGTIVDADLQKLMGWSDAVLHASIHQIHGQGLSTNSIGNLMAVSGIEAPATTRLFNLWIEQKLGPHMTLRVGQITAAQELFVSQNANLFVNSTFGWPAITALDLPGGGPAYPEATPGARLKITPNDQLTFMAAVFNGDPAGPGAGNPVDRDPHGLAFRLNDPPLLMAEVAYAYNQGQVVSGLNPHQEGMGRPTASHETSAGRVEASGLPGTFKLGAWYHAGRFADQRVDIQGLSLADPATSGQPRPHRGNSGVYAIVDQMLARAPSGANDQGLSGFLRGSVSPSDRNLVDLYADAGLTYKGLILGRADDIAGAAFAFARISPQARAFDQDVVTFTGAAMPIRDYEASIELTYQAQITHDWSVQPDFQYIVHPGGHAPSPSDPSGMSAIPNAMVFGIRSVSKF
jgi:porin